MALTRLTVQNGGNVGVGTTSPQAKLDVNGRARVQALEGQPGQPVDVYVSGLRGLRLEPLENELYSNTVNVLGGSPANSIGPYAYGSVIAGGGATVIYNVIGPVPYPNSVYSPISIHRGRHRQLDSGLCRGRDYRWWPGKHDSRRQCTPPLVEARPTRSSSMPMKRRSAEGLLTRLKPLLDGRPSARASATGSRRAPGTRRSAEAVLIR